MRDDELAEITRRIYRWRMKRRVRALSLWAAMAIGATGGFVAVLRFLGR